MADASSFTGIRLAVPADIKTIAVLISAAFTKYVSRIGHKPAPMLSDAATWVENGNYYVLEADGELKGAVNLVQDGRALQIDTIVVAPNAQGHGWGGTLLKWAERLAQERGLDALTLYTNAAMHENLTFYPQMGFVEVRRASEEGFDRVFFRKELVPRL